MARNIIIFGASLGGKRALRHLKKGDKAIFFSDNDSKKFGTFLSDLEIIAPKDIILKDFDIILIASSYVDEIFSQLVEMGIEYNKIEVVSSEILSGDYDFPGGCLPVLMMFLLGLFFIITVLLMI